MSAITLTGRIFAADAPKQVKLAAPYATPSSTNRSQVVPRPDGAQLKLPAGFKIEEYAAGFERPRFMLAGPSGEILLTDMTPKGSVYVLQDKNKHF